MLRSISTPLAWNQQHNTSSFRASVLSCKKSEMLKVNGPLTQHLYTETPTKGNIPFLILQCSPIFQKKQKRSLYYPIVLSVPRQGLFSAKWPIWDLMNMTYTARKLTELDTWLFVLLRSTPFSFCFFLFFFFCFYDPHSSDGHFQSSFVYGPGEG